MKAIVMNKDARMDIINLNKDDNIQKGITLRMKASGICGTDLHIINQKKNKEKAILGHEFYGEITKINGSEKVKCLNGEASVGDLVTVIPGIVCCECSYCKKIPERKNYCLKRSTFGLNVFDTSNNVILGGNTQELFVSEKYTLYKVDSSWPIGWGTLLEPVSVSVKAVAKAEKYASNILGRRLTAIVLGAGTIGFFICMALKNKGIDVIAIEKNMNRIDLLKENGIERAYSYEELNCEKFNVYADEYLGEMGADIVFEAVGEPDIFKEALYYARKGGVIVEVGNFVNIGYTTLEPSYICNNELIVVGSVLADETYYFEAEELINEMLNKSDNILKNYQIEEFENAYEDAFRRNNGLKVNIVFEG